MTSEPTYRFNLKAKIHASGFKTLHEFAESSRLPRNKISRVINGWEIPSHDMQVIMARHLKMRIKAFKALL